MSIHWTSLLAYSRRPRPTWVIFPSILVSRVPVVKVIAIIELALRPSIEEFSPLIFCLIVFMHEAEDLPLSRPLSDKVNDYLDVLPNGDALFLFVFCVLGTEEHEVFDMLAVITYQK